MGAFLAWLLPLLAKIGIDFMKARQPAPIVVESEKAGAAEDGEAVLKQQVATAGAEAQAAVDAPKTQTAVVDSLNKGTF